MTMIVDNAGPADDPALLALNQAALPAVNSLDPSAFAALRERAHFVGVARAADLGPVGFLLALLPGSDYASVNYRWFCERYSRFSYVDRIVVAPGLAGRGVGRMLYRALYESCPPGVDAVACEVNLEPPNPQSLAFHRRLGFDAVGERQNGPGKRVRLLIKTPIAKEPLARGV